MNTLTDIKKFKIMIYIKKTFWKTIFKIGFIKKWYIGNEMLKNPPTVIASEGSVINSLVLTNVTLRMKNGEIKNSSFINTIKLKKYF